MNKKLFTYKKSGVNIDAADKFVNFIANISTKKRGHKKFNNIGGFGSISDIPKNIKTDLINFDYSKQRVNHEALDFLVDIPDQLEIRDSLDNLFAGDFKNPSESRNVSHTIYRSKSSIENFEVIFSERKKIKQFLNQIKEDKSIKNIISISIGGSRLGPELLHEFDSNINSFKVYFCSSYDLIELIDALKSCTQEDTIVFAVSKSFETIEILKNLDYVKSWFSEIPNIDFRDRLYGVSSNFLNSIFGAFFICSINL